MARYFVLDKYNTWYDWHLLLTAKDVTPPEAKTNYVSLDGMNGTLDLSESLTGEVTYNDRTVTATFMTDWGTHDERVALFREIALALHGKKVKIVEPDDPGHYFMGRVKIKSQTYTSAYAEIAIEATCEPWRYAVEPISRTVKVSGDIVNAVVHNNGAKTVVPVVTVSGSIAVSVNGVATMLPTGSYKVSAVRLHSGANVVSVSGNGSVTFTYTEGDL